MARNTLKDWKVCFDGTRLLIFILCVSLIRSGMDTLYTFNETLAIVTSYLAGGLSLFYLSLILYFQRARWFIWILILLLWAMWIGSLIIKGPSAFWTIFGLLHTIVR